MLYKGGLDKAHFFIFFFIWAFFFIAYETEMRTKKDINN